MKESDAAVDNLDGLVERLHRDGVEAGKREAEALLARAREEAARIRAEARKEAEGQREAVRGEMRREREVLEGARRQVARDLALELGQLLRERAAAFVHESCRDRLDREGLLRLLESVATEWVRSQGKAPLEAGIAEADLAAFENGVLERLRTSLQTPLEVRVADGVEAGFVLSMKGETMVCDFSAEALAEALAARLQPRFARRLEKPPEE